MCGQSHRRAERTATRSRFISHSSHLLWLTLHECTCAIVQNRPSKSHSSLLKNQESPSCSRHSVALGTVWWGGWNRQKWSKSLFFLLCNGKKSESHKKKEEKHIKSIYLNWSLDSVEQTDLSRKLDEILWNAMPTLLAGFRRFLMYSHKWLFSVVTRRFYPSKMSIMSQSLLSYTRIDIFSSSAPTDSVALQHPPSQNGMRKLRVYMFPIAANNLRGSRYIAKIAKLYDICVLSRSN